MPHREQGAGAQGRAEAHEQVKPFELREFFLDLVRSFVPSAYARLAAQPASTAALRNLEWKCDVQAMTATSMPLSITFS